MNVCEAIARLHQDVEIDIFGRKIDAMDRWHSSLPPQVQERIHVYGVQPGEKVVQSLQCSQIYFSPSSFESGPQTIFEGLACGVTTVSLDSPELTGAGYAAKYNHADLAQKDTTEAFVEALDQGLKKWERGEYSAQAISDFWCEKTHVSKVVQVMLEAAAAARSPANAK